MASSQNAWHRWLQAGWIKPLIFLILLGVGWHFAIRIFHIPPYQIPAPADVLITLWEEWPKLLAEAVPTTTATVEGFVLSALFGIPMAMLIVARAPSRVMSIRCSCFRSRSRRSPSRSCSWCGSASA